MYDYGAKFNGIQKRSIALDQGHRAFGRAFLTAFSSEPDLLFHTRFAFGSDDTPSQITIITALH